MRTPGTSPPVDNPVSGATWGHLAWAFGPGDHPGPIARWRHLAMDETPQPYHTPKIPVNPLTNPTQGA